VAHVGPQTVAYAFTANTQPATPTAPKERVAQATHAEGRVSNAT
jgi:hypothetical protein